MGDIAVMVPLYIHPSETAEWDKVFRFPPKEAWINIANGPGNLPGRELDEVWAGKIGKLRSLGVEVGAYVPLGYGQRPLLSVVEDMWGWKIYRQVRYFFFDEVPNDRKFLGPFSPMASAYKSTAWTGAGQNVMNLGTKPYDDTVGVSTMRNTRFVTFEDTAATYLHYPEVVARTGIHLVHSCPVEQAPEVFARAAEYGPIGLYVTPDTPPNPWNTYWPQKFLAKGTVVNW